MIKYVRILPSLPSLSSNQRVSQLKGNKPCLYTGPIIDHNLGHPSLSKPPLFLSFSPLLPLPLSLSLFHSKTRWRQWTQGRSIFPGSLKIIRNTVLLPSFLLPVSPFIFISFSLGRNPLVDSSILWYYIFCLLIFPFVLQLKIEILYWWRLKYFRSFWN